MKVFLSFFFLVLTSYCFSQFDTIDAVEAEATAIDKSLTSMREFDSMYLQGIPNLDNGAIYRIWMTGNAVAKVEQHLGPSYGRLKTIIYLHEENPIKIIETEELFERHTDGSLNYKNLQEVYREVYYVFDWENDVAEIVRNGKREMSKGSRSIYELAEPILEEAERLSSLMN